MTLFFRFNQTIIIAKRSDVVAPPVYIGGLPDDAAKPSSISDNFRGCLQQIYVNDVSQIKPAPQKTKIRNDTLLKSPSK